MIKQHPRVIIVIKQKTNILNEVLRAGREDWGGRVYEEKQKIKFDFN